MKDYFHYTRSAWPAFLFTLPLLVAYQATAFFANLGSRQSVINGADGLLQQGLAVVGIQGWLGSGLVVALLAALLCYRADGAYRDKPIRARYFPALLLESSLYALAFGAVVVYLLSLIIPEAWRLQIGGQGITFGQKLAVSLGAGLYEELVFRLLLTGGLMLVLRQLRWRAAVAVPVAVILSAFIFSGFHYVGTMADQFELGSFAFRWMAGIVLAALFATRGFAVAAWTHSLYDVFLLLSGRG